MQLVPFILAIVQYPIMNFEIVAICGYSAAEIKGIQRAGSYKIRSLRKSAPIVIHDAVPIH
jgi:hypothetical protein